MVVRREGAGTSGRERERPGEGAGGGVSERRLPTGAGLGPAGQPNTNTGLVLPSPSGHVCVCEESRGFRFHSLTLLNSPSGFYPLKAVAYSVFSKKIVKGCTLSFSPFFMSAILKVNESYIALRHHIQFNSLESKTF